ncbi:TonB-dependent receptor [Psychrobacter sp. JCM 18902]|uniref:TonB-dependent receptor n=1 Tax=Psychrobacter sp. JCM 18902 TaxID=1298607 RepID=UPI00191B23FA|nr:TonB-dependent receptor [Psychrobacter sp. JCM 18902]
MSSSSMNAVPILKLSVLALSLLHISSAYADSTTVKAHLPTTDDEPHIQLPEIVVYATAADKRSSTNALGTAATLDQKFINSKQVASSDTATILTKIPGLNVQSAGGISNLPVMRGLADNRLRILVDGVDSIASCPNSMNSPLSYIAPSAIEKTTVYAGVTPVSVGGNSIGGTIVVETAEPMFSTDSDILTSGEIGTFYRSNGDAYGANLSTTAANDQLSLTYKGSFAQADNYKAGGDFKFYTETGNAGKTLAKDEVGSTAYESKNQSVDVAYKNGNHLLQGTYLWQNVPKELYPNQRMDMLDNQLDRINLRYKSELNWGQLEAQAYHEDVDHYMNFGEDKQFLYGNAKGMPMYTSSETIGANLKGIIDLTNQSTLNIGAEYQDYTLDDTWAASGDGMMSPNDFQNINNGQRQRIGIYGEWEKDISPDWSTQLGARYENVRTSADEVHGYQIDGQNNMTNQLRDSANFNASDRRTTDNNFDITALARYNIDSQKNLALGLSHKERTPSLYERYTWSTWKMAAIMNNTVGDGNGYFGDPNLRPEKSNTLSATLDWRGADDSWGVKATPYYSKIDDYVDAVQWNPMANTAASTQTANQYNVLHYTNQDAEIYGIDISANRELATNAWGYWNMVGSLSYTKGKNKDSGSDLYNIMPFNGSVALNRENNGWTNQIEVVGVAAKNDISTPRNEIKTAGYGLLNLSTGYQFKEVAIEAGIDNVFDKNYDLPLGGAYMGQGKTMSMNGEIGSGSNWGTAVPGAGRSLYVGVNYKF